MGDRYVLVIENGLPQKEAAEKALEVLKANPDINKVHCQETGFTLERVKPKSEE
jgi:hypothetical protein